MEQAKQTRSIYWHIPTRGNSIEARTEARVVLNTGQGYVEAGERLSTQSNQDRVRRLDPDGGAENTRVPLEPRAPAPSLLGNQASSAQSLTQGETFGQVVTIETIQHPGPVQEQRTQVTQQESREQQPDFPIDPQLLQMDETFTAQPTSDALQGNIEDQNEDAWLDNIFNNENYHEWVPDVMQTDPSPLTSVPTGPQTGPRQIHRSCQCAAHEHLYNDWPRRDAELRIAKCMTICMYCGVDYGRPPTLRQHLKSARHAQDNISVVVETQGRGSAATPSWTHKPRVEGAQDGQITRRRISTHRANRLSRQ